MKPEICLPTPRPTPTPPAPPRAAVRRPTLAAAVLLTLCTALPATAAVDAPFPAPPPQEAPHLEIRRRSGLAPPQRSGMEDWHRRYRRDAAPVKKALAELLEARRRYRPHQLGPECRSLHRRVRSFFAAAEENRLFPVADTAVDYHLKHLYGQLDAAAVACLKGRWGASDGHLRRAGRAFEQARLALGRWDLAP